MRALVSFFTSQSLVFFAKLPVLFRFLTNQKRWTTAHSEYKLLLIYRFRTFFFSEKERFFWIFEDECARNTWRIPSTNRMEPVAGMEKSPRVIVIIKRWCACSSLVVWKRFAQIFKSSPFPAPTISVPYFTLLFGFPSTWDAFWSQPPTLYFCLICNFNIHS